MRLHPKRGHEFGGSSRAGWGLRDWLRGFGFRFLGFNHHGDPAVGLRSGDLDHGAIPGLRETEGPGDLGRQDGVHFTASYTRKGAGVVGQICHILALLCFVLGVTFLSSIQSAGSGYDPTMSGFGTVCEVKVGNSYNTCGTVTRSNIATLTPTQIQALYNPSSGVWAEMDALLRHQIEMKACGVRRSSLYDWIMSSNKPGLSSAVSLQRINKGPSLVVPYILGRQQSIVNSDHWYVTANVAADASNADDHIVEDGGVAGTSGNRILTVKSSFASTLTPSKDYFLPGKNIHFLSKNGSGQWTITQFKVIQAGVGTGVTDEIDIEVKLNQGTTSTIPTNATGTSGLVFAGINNVKDIESWCYNMVNTTNTKLVPFWYQTRRWQRCIDSEYRKIFENLMANNAWFAKFQELTLAERNRQDEVRDQKEWMHAFFFGEKISDNQTVTGYASLDQVSSATGATVDPGTGSKFISYRANMIGVVPQLHSCGQFNDNAGADLEIKTWLETEIYNLWRARDSRGRPANEIDVYTDQGTADEIMQAYIGYSKEKLGDIVRLNIDEGTTSIGFPFRRFKLYKPHGVYLNVLTDPFFDDMVAAASGNPGPNYAGLGKFLMTLDLGSGGSIYPGILGSNRKQYTTGEIDQLAKIDKTFACVMENPTIDRTLVSTTTTAIVECPYDSLVEANFAKVKHSNAL